MSDRVSKHWLRFVAEGVVIVASILFALWADASWELWKQRAGERQIIEALILEFATAETEIRNDLRARTGILETTRRWREARGARSLQISADSVISDVTRLLNYRFYTPSHPELDDILSSGRLELLRSEEIRRALLRYVQARSRIGVPEQEERDFVAQRVEPFLGPRLDLDFLYSEPPDPAAIAGASEAIAALGEGVEFGSILYYKQFITSGALAFSEELLESILAVQSALSAARTGG